MEAGTSAGLLTFAVPLPRRGPPSSSPRQTGRGQPRLESKLPGPGFANALYLAQAPEPGAGSIPTFGGASLNAVHAGYCLVLRRCAHRRDRIHLSGKLWYRSSALGVVLSHERPH